MSLQSWLENGWVVAHKSSKREIASLLRIAERDLRDSKTVGLSNDWRLVISYNAALQVATAALAASGFRPGRDGNHHYRVIQSLELTIGADAKVVQGLDAFRKKRNASNYDSEGSVSDGEAKQMQEIAIQLGDDVRRWLGEKHPDLV